MKKNPLFISTIFLNLKMVILYFTLEVINFLVDLLEVSLFISSFIFAIFAAIFIVYLHNHISYKKQRTYLVVVASLMLLFIVFRGLKYGPFDSIDIFSRHLWYLYYLPAIFIPYFLLIASLTNVNNYKNIKIVISVVTLIISTLIFTLIITNDLHQLAFSFKEDYADWNSDYQRHFIYYLAFFWSGLLIISSFLIMIIKGPSLKVKKYSLLALIPLILGSLFFIFDIFKLLPKINGRSVLGSFPEAMCFMIACFILTSMKLGMIASNDDYVELFLKSSFPAYIIDKKENIVYSSSSNREDNRFLWPKQNENIIVHDENIYNLSIKGGGVIWFEDIKQINAINKKLDETNERLKEEEHIYRLNNSLKEEEIITSEKNALYDDIANEVSHETLRILFLSNEANQNPSLFRNNMLLVCFYSSYIKRLSNLKLIAQEKKEIKIDELYLSILETCRFLEKMNVKTYSANNDNQTYDSELIINLYKSFKQLIEDNIDYISAVSVILNTNQMKIIIEGKELINSLKDNDFYYLSHTKEDGYFFTFTYILGGHKNEA